MRFLLILVFIAFSLLVTWVVYDDVRSTAIDYVSGIGSVASVCAIVLALIEFRSAKKKAEEMKDAIEGKVKEVNYLLSFADIERLLQLCTTIGQSIQNEQFEAAIMKLDEIKKGLIEIKNNKKIIDKNEDRIQKLVMRIGSDVTSIRNKWLSKGQFDVNVVMIHLNETSTFLQDISSKIKQQAL